MDTNTNKQIALVTGGSRGIGAAIALELGAANHIVIINYNHSKEEADKIATKINEIGGEAYVVQGNISNAEECTKMCQTSKENHGAIDILVNNAGITRDKSFRKMSAVEWNEVINTNLSSAFHLCQMVIPDMIAQTHGRIINISSVIGLSGGFGQTNYAAAKAGLIGFSKSLALETAKYGITVNCICPGFIETEMVKAMPQEVLNSITEKIPVKRFGATSDISKGVKFLVESAYMTGQCLNINGGLYMQ